MVNKKGSYKYICEINPFFSFSYGSTLPEGIFLPFDKNVTVILALTSTLSTYGWKLVRGLHGGLGARGKLQCIGKLDGVGPVDNRPSTN